MNILLVTETYLPWITGVSISTFNIAKYMASRGHKITIACPTPIVKGKIPKIPNCKVVFVPAYPFTFYNLRATAILPLAIVKIDKLVRMEKYDLIHIQEPAETGVAALIAAKKYKIPVTGYLHFIPEQIDRVLWGSAERILTPIINVYVRFIYDKYNIAMTPSHFFKNYLKFLGVKTPIEVVSNGVEIDKFKPRPKNLNFRKKYNIPENKVLFMYLGRLDGDKNVTTLVKATEHVDKNAHMPIIGKGKIKNYLHDLAKNLKSDSKITWIDYVTDEEMIEAYNASDVFTIMSPYEGQSIVTLQAAASGLPIIAANAGALPEICRDNENGYLCHSLDDQTLAKKMNILTKNTKLRYKMGKESRKISLMHNRSTVLKKLEDLFLTVRTNVGSTST